MEFSGNFGSLVDISGNFILVGFNGILRSVESSGFFIYRVDINGISRLVESGGFFVYRVGISGILMSVEFSKISSLVANGSGFLGAIVG